jgi:hypothetical protein
LDTADFPWIYLDDPDRHPGSANAIWNIRRTGLFMATQYWYIRIKQGIIGVAAVPYGLQVVYPSVSYLSSPHTALLRCRWTAKESMSPSTNAVFPTLAVSTQFTMIWENSTRGRPLDMRCLRYYRACICLKYLPLVLPRLVLPRSNPGPAQSISALPHKCPV